MYHVESFYHLLMQLIELIFQLELANDQEEMTMDIQMELKLLALNTNIVNTDSANQEMWLD